MCPAPGQITIILCVRRAATSQPGRIAANLFVRRARKNMRSDCKILCSLHYLAGECLRHSPEELPQIYLSGARVAVTLCGARKIR